MLQINGTVYIVGPRRVQNELIASCLHQETGVRCELGDDISGLQLRDEPLPDCKPNLLLWDCQERDPQNLVARLRASGIHKSSSNYIVLFNVHHDLGIEEECLWRGIRGFLYNNDSLSQFVKGVEAVLNGQLWFSRKTMTKCITENKRARCPDHREEIPLTQREVEILVQLAVGRTNQEIADRLCISPHTVKTHLYNIYKKINTSNRLQAALWAARNL
ncbi:MAG: response regulator transcription factor [Thermodesulfobacteriota bacterium]|nr:response regulator transcription factor [Thermodesulfobacteriota bacterium]